MAGLCSFSWHCSSAIIFRSGCQRAGSRVSFFCIWGCYSVHLLHVHLLHVHLLQQVTSLHHVRACVLAPSHLSHGVQQCVCAREAASIHLSRCQCPMPMLYVYWK